MMVSGPGWDFIHFAGIDVSLGLLFSEKVLLCDLGWPGMSPECLRLQAFVNIQLRSYKYKG